MPNVFVYTYEEPRVMGQYERCAVEGCLSRQFAGGLCTDIIRPHATTLVQEVGPFFIMRRYCAGHLAEYNAEGINPKRYVFDNEKGYLVEEVPSC
ncbi:MAG: hypothetical protein U1B30_15895 [Pseudomonadota bacterium]|nr:hypothetical protein [Pseudomonadota bacterium]